MELSKKTKRDRPSTVNDGLSDDVGQGGCSPDRFIKQMQKNKSDSEELDIK